MGIVLLLLAAGCDGEGEAKRIDLSRREVTRAAGKENELRVIVGAMLTPQEGILYYRQLALYIAEKLGRPVRMVDRTSYAQVNELLKARKVDLAFVCTGPYVRGHEEFGLELLAAPQVNGVPEYHSYIIVPRGSSAKRLVDLRGKSFAFTDPLSLTGTLTPAWMLAREGEDPDTFFRATKHSHAHDRSIKWVAEGLVDGAAVDGLIWEYLHATRPQLTAETRVVEKSPGFAIPPVVVHPDMDGALKARLRQIFLRLHEEERGRRILEGMKIERFVPIHDSAYDFVRKVRRETQR